MIRCIMQDSETGLCKIPGPKWSFIEFLFRHQDIAPIETFGISDHNICGDIFQCLMTMVLMVNKVHCDNIDT